MGSWELVSIALPLIVAYKFWDLRWRLLGNRRRFASIFPAGMQRVFSIWIAIAAITLISAPSLMVAGVFAEIPRLLPFGICLCLYSVIWAFVGHYILRAQREYVRWWRLRRDVIHYLSTPIHDRPPNPPAGAVLI